MKSEDIPELRSKILPMLPITQAQLRGGKLGISNRDLTNLVSILEKEGFLTKTEVLYNSRWTWMLQPLDGKVIIANAPCIGCMPDCDPNICKKLYDWLRE